MQIYRVGGAVRDQLLGRPVQDIDHVVTGATPEQMLALGYKAVGGDFPVFLHPHTGEEYALARTERKSGHGYQGFTVYTSPDVTLEEDLARRDLTINAIAARADQGSSRAVFDDESELIDPFGGRRDLRDRVLRHVTDAFREDPVRILRVARFAARFHDFSVAPETQALMREMVADGEVDHLVPERVWQELARGLMETPIAPSSQRMLPSSRPPGYNGGKEGTWTSSRWNCFRPQPVVRRSRRPRRWLLTSRRCWPVSSVWANATRLRSPAPR